jgi:superkiller protein 3
VVAYEQALRLNPNYDTAYNNLGIALRKLKRYEEAVVAYEQALRLNPNYDTAYNNLGYALDELKRYEEAVVAYEQALRLNPNSDKAYNNLGWLYETQGKLQDAMTQYERALEINPNDSFAKNNRDALAEQLNYPKITVLSYTELAYLEPNTPQTKIKRSVVALTPIFSEGRQTTRTGFIIQRTGQKLIIITNYHNLDDDQSTKLCDYVEVKFFLGNIPKTSRAEFLRGEVRQVDKDLDLAVIELDLTKLTTNLPEDIQGLSFQAREDSAEVLVIGHPQGENLWQEKRGSIKRSVPEKGLELAIRINVGYSGSPALNSDYQVLGIIRSITTEEAIEENTAYAIPARQILEKLKSWGIIL